MPRMARFPRKEFRSLSNWRSQAKVIVRGDSFVQNGALSRDNRDCPMSSRRLPRVVARCSSPTSRPWIYPSLDLKLQTPVVDYLPQ